MQPRLIIGLGNPGRQYLETRHNAGFLLLDRLIDRYNATLCEDQKTYVLWSFRHDDGPVYLMKPLTYMNLSGHAVAEFIQRHPMNHSDILVAYDDVALPVGALRARPGGSAGGQKGIRHIMETLDDTQIPRLRIGIDSPLRAGLSLPDFVLADFAEDEVPLIRKAFDLAVDAVSLWLSSDMPTVMAQVNNKGSSSSITDQGDASRSPAMEE